MCSSRFKAWVLLTATYSIHCFNKVPTGLNWKTTLHWIYIAGFVIYTATTIKVTDAETFVSTNGAVQSECRARLGYIQYNWFTHAKSDAHIKMFPLITDWYENVQMWCEAIQNSQKSSHRTFGLVKRRASWYQIIYWFRSLTNRFIDFLPCKLIYLSSATLGDNFVYCLSVCPCTSTLFNSNIVKPKTTYAKHLTDLTLTNERSCGNKCVEKNVMKKQFVIVLIYVQLTRVENFFRCDFFLKLFRLFNYISAGFVQSEFFAALLCASKTIRVPHIQTVKQ